MKIYCAGVYTGLGRSIMNTGSIHLQVSAKYLYPHVLESFHFADKVIMEAIQRNKQAIFLDSGAYSMHTRNVKVDLNKYARFIQYYDANIEVASNLDVIGAGHEQETYDRQKQLENLLGENSIKPVHHVRDHDDWLKKYMDEGYDYIFLGGMVPEPTPVLMQWLDHVFHYYLTNPDGTAKVKIHGFGLTTEKLMFRYPFYSVDSTSWILTSRYGALMMDIPQVDGSMKIVKVDFSDRSPKRYEMDSWHFLSLPTDDQEAVRIRLDQLEAERVKDPELEAAFEKELGCKMGFNPEALGKSYGLRDVGNMEYFRRAMDRRVDRFTRAQDTLFDLYTKE